MIFYSLWFITSLAVNIIGLVWRYGEAGKFASETHNNIGTDELLQLKSARFMNIYYIVTLAGLGLLICAVGVMYVVRRRK